MPRIQPRVRLLPSLASLALGVLACGEPLQPSTPPLPPTTASPDASPPVEPTGGRPALDAAPDTVMVEPGETVIIDVLWNDSVSPDDTVTVTLLSLPIDGHAQAAANVVTYTSPESYRGAEHFAYELARDTERDTAFISVQVGMGLSTLVSDGKELVIASHAVFPTPFPADGYSYMEIGRASCRERV